jgi:perosamine synthetase
LEAGIFSKRDHFRKVISLNKSNTDPLLSISAAEPIHDLNGELLGYLTPIAEHDREQKDSWRLLASWREKHQYAYPSSFKVTASGTGVWLSKAVLDNENRIIFWIRNKNMVPLGHVGVIFSENDGAFEVDNVLRGEAGSPGIMKFAMLKLESWVEEEFSAETIQLRVLKSNHRALSFYEGLGYVTTQETPLVKEINDEGYALVEGTPAEDFFVTKTKSLLKQGIPELILTAGPSIGSLERAFGLSAISSGWNSRHSDFLNSFEKSFADYVGAKYAMATSSCTGALHLSLLALGVVPGDEVIVPEVTWVATASAVRYVGATPVFADIDPDTWTMTRETVSKVLTPKTRAIMPVHLYGFGAQMNDLMALARERDLAVVEDAAPAIGTLIDGKAAGTFGDFGCYSFQGAKMLVTGEGGMLVTDNEELFMKARKIQDHGRRVGTFWIEELGYKYKMSNTTAAIGLGQLIRGENQIFRKQRIRSWYEEDLAGVNQLSFQEEAKNTRSIHWMNSIKLSSQLSISRDEFIKELKSHGVDSRPVFPAISQYPFWPKKFEPKENALLVGDSSINLPSGVLLTRDSIAKIGSVIRKVISENV